jgi:hypothetical protein
MPTIRWVGPYRFYFYSSDGDEPAHVHVRRDAARAKFWLRPVALASPCAFSGREIRRLQVLVERHRDDFEEAWHEFFGA